MGIDQEDQLISISPIQNKEKQRQKKYQDLVTIIKTVKLADILQLNKYVDVFDSFGTWRNGYILEINKNDEVKIRFDGWSEKYDECHRINSSKIALFRQHSDPYTGGTKQALRVFPMDRMIDLIRITNEKFIQISSKQFQNLIPEEICQFLRGEVYFVLDQILQESGILRDEDIKASIEFIEGFLKFFVDWMDHITTSEVILDYIEGKALSSIIYYYDAQVGIVACYAEFFDIINSIMNGGQIRTKRFYQTYQNYFNKTVLYSGQFAQQQRENRINNLHPLVQNFTNFFGNIGGFEKLKNLLQWTSVDQGEVKQRIPFPILKSILQTIESFGRILNLKFRDEYFLGLKEIIFQRLQNLTPYDLKDQQMNIMFQAVKMIPNSLYLPKIQQESEQLEVRLAITFIRSLFLDKKVRGVKELTDIIEKTNKNYMYKVNDEYNSRYFNEVNLANFLVEEKIFELLLTDAWHAEVFKRAIPVLKFMVIQTSITGDQIDALWTATQNKHENEVKAVLDAIAELTKVMTVDALDQFYEKISNHPLEDYNNQFLIFLKEFTINSINSLQMQFQGKNNKIFQKPSKNQQQQQQQQQLKQELYGLNLLWELTQDGSALNTSLISSAIASFINCIKSPTFKNERERFLQSSLENFKKGVSVPQSLYIIQNIVDCYGNGSSWRGEGSEDVLNRIYKEYNLIDLIISDLDKYVKSNQNVAMMDPLTQIITGKIDHQHNITYRLEFLEYINNIIPKKELTTDQFRRLWSSLVLNPLHENDKNYLIDLMIKQSSFSSKYSLFRDKHDEIFKVSLSDPLLFNKLNLQFFKSIEKYFMNINQKNQSITISKQLIRVSKFENIIGVDFFWIVLQKCTQEDIVSQACSILVNIYLRTEKVSQTDARLNMWQHFLVKCKDVLKNIDTDVRAKGNVIRCLKGLLTKIDGKKYLIGTEPSKQLIKFTVQMAKDEKTLRTLSLPSNLTFLEMRRIICKEYALGVQDFELYFSNYDVKLSVESEEDYSIQQIEEAPNKRDKTDVIIQNLSSNPFPGFVCVSKLRSLQSNWEVAEALFELLQSASDIYFDDIWEVLTLLPQNKQIKQQIESPKTTDGSEEQWNRLLHFSCQRKLLYCLQIVDSIIQERREKQDVRWAQDFLKSKGLYWLLMYYSKMGDNSDFTVIFNLKCYAQISKLISYFIKNFISQNIQYFDYMGNNNNNNNNNNQQEKQMRLLIDISNRSLGYLLKFFEKVQNKSYQDNITIQDFINGLMELVGLCLQLQPGISNSIMQSRYLQSLVQRGVIDFQDQGGRRALQNQILALIQGQPIFQQHLLKYISDTFNKNIILSRKDQVNEYMSLIGGILQEIKDPMTQIPFTLHIIEIVLECSQQEDYESVLGGAFQLLSGAINASSQSAQMILENQKLFNVIIKDCLFQLPSSTNQGQLVLAKCQQTENRKEGYTLLLKLLQTDDSLQSILKVLSQYIESAYWRNHSYQNWNISQMTQQKSRTGFVGLKNLGCICYMNSMLQQLFTLPHFRDAILQVPMEPKPSSVLYQFQILLSALKSSQKQYYDPRSICNVLGQDGQPINVMEQMDVDEFWSGFMDKLENELKPMRKELIIKRNFGGLLSNELICKGCPHQSSREELFLALPLQVKNKKNILASLQTMTEGEMLEGDNAYFCEKCEKKIPTLMRVCIKKLPNVLLCVMKRFEFNIETFTKQKLNDFCEFPQKLDMKPYTREYLYSKDQAEKGDEDAAPLELPEYPAEYYEYSLRGVIIHMGTADSGHYYSLIQDGKDQWFEFNDTIVKQFDINDLGSVAFGADGANQNQQSNGMMKDRNLRNAYMVFYERNVYFDDNGRALRQENEINWFFNRVGIENNQISLNNVEQAGSYNSEILQDNLKFQVSKIMFEKSFYEFSFGLLNQAESDTNPQRQFQIGQYCLQYFLTVVVRSQDRKELPKYLRIIKKILRTNLQLSQKLIESFLSIEIINEFIIHNSVVDMKYVIVGLISASIGCIAYQFDNRVSYTTFKEQSYNAKLTLICLQLLWEKRLDTKKCDQLYRILSILCTSSTNNKMLLLKNKAVGRICLFFLEEPPIGVGYQDLNELIKQYEPQNNLLKFNPALLDSSDTPVLSTQTVSPWDISYNNYTYLILTLSDLIYALNVGLNQDKNNNKNNNPNGLNLQNQDFSLDDDEVALIEDQSIIQRLVSLSYTRKARKSLATMFQSLLNMDTEEYDPWERSRKIVMAIYLLLKDCEEKELKSGLTSLISIAQVRDAYEDQRCQLVVEVLILILKDGLNLWYHTEIIFDSIIKACAQNKKILLSVHNVLSQNKSVHKLIENWILQSQNPYNHFQCQRWKILRKRPGNISGSDFSSNLKWFTDKAIHRMNQLKSIMQKQSIEQLNYDSDDELTLGQLEINCKVDAIYPPRQVNAFCYDYTGYGTYQITDSMDDMIELKLIPQDTSVKQQGNQQNNMVKWFFFDDESITKPGTAAIKYANYVNFFK